MDRRVELKLRYENGEVIDIVAEQGLIKGKPAAWKMWRIVKNVTTDEEELWAVEVAVVLRRQIAEYFGIRFV